MLEIDLLVIQPWIYDFSAHDFWLKPYGLLKLGGLLRKLGYSIYYLDLLDPFHPELPAEPKRKNYGIGFFYKEVIPKPRFFDDIPRRFFRYGLPYHLAVKELLRLKPKAILTSVTMTYWYPGLFTVLTCLRDLYPEVPIFVGGIYARLQREHLTHFLEKEGLPTVKVITSGLEEAVKEITSTVKPSALPHLNDYPIFDLQRKLPYVILLTSEGCPYQCPYCASRQIYQGFKAYDTNKILEEIIYWQNNFGVKDFAFYDDALLFNFDNHLKHLLERLLELRLKVRFHTPNALHARFITKEVALLLKETGFTTIRLGLERVENRFDSKVNKEEFLTAIKALKEAGYKPHNLGAYVIFGIPYENFSEVERTLYFLYEHQVPPYLAEFSPVPNTPFFKLCQEISRYPLLDDPLFHNKSTFPAFRKPDWDRIHRIKNLAREIRIRLISSV